MRIELLWPDSHLSPNARCHWAVKARYNHDAKWDGYMLARSIRDERDIDRAQDENKYTMSLTFCPPDRRRRDLDNAEASCKAAFDGMCAGLGIDDSQIVETSKRWGEVVKGGKVIVEISELERME